MLSGLTSAFVSNITDSEQISSAVSEQLGVAAGTGIDFVSSDQIGAAAMEAGLDEATAQAIVDDYESAQLQALKTGLLAAAALALLSLAFTKDLPHHVPTGESDPGETPAEPIRVNLAGPEVGRRLLNQTFAEPFPRHGQSATWQSVRGGAEWQ